MITNGNSTLPIGEFIYTQIGVITQDQLYGPQGPVGITSPSFYPFAFEEPFARLYGLSFLIKSKNPFDVMTSIGCNSSFEPRCSLRI